MAKKQIIDKEVSKQGLSNILNKLNSVMKSDIAKFGDIQKKQIFISSGNALLDLIVSNRKKGGIACTGRITQLNGLPSAGKSLVAAHCIVQMQKLGGMCVLIYHSK